MAREEEAAVATGLGPVGLGIGALSLLGGAIGSMSGGGDYDPERRALKRFYELTDPNSAHFKKLRAFYGKTLADAGPTADTLYGLARTGGVSTTSASALALAQGEKIAGQNREKVGDMISRDVFNSEQMAQGYLNMEYDRARNERDDQGGFFNQLLGLGGGLLSKVI